MSCMQRNIWTLYRKKEKKKEEEIYGCWKTERNNNRIKERAGLKEKPHRLLTMRDLVE